MSMIDYDRLETERETIRAQFRDAKPFRWMLLDGFLRDPWPQRLYEEFTDVVVRSGKNANAPKKHNHVLRKIGIHRPEQMNEVHRNFFQEIQSEQFLAWLRDVLGIEALYADAKLHGGGLHEIHQGGYLNVHTDFNFHPETNQHRRLNILYYLNPVWEPEWSGNLELWPTDLSGPFAEIAPLMNRMAIFETSEVSFHGHPKPLRVPPGVTRRSLAAYYYSDWPEGLEQRAKTNYRLVPWQVETLRGAITQLRAEGKDDPTILDTLALTYQLKDVAKVMNSMAPATA